VHRLRGVSEPRHLFSAVEPAVGPAPAATALEVAGEPGTAFAAGLTVREVDVLRLVGAGLSDADVAARLYLSVRTVNAHLRAIYRKTGVHSRAAASRFAAEHGLL
jgi:DNA-binding NarL/FixJ family response regulator